MTPRSRQLYSFGENLRGETGVSYFPSIFRRAASQEWSVLSGHYGVCLLNFFMNNFFLWDLKNSKMRACFSTFWATFIFWPPPPPQTPYRTRNFVRFQKFRKQEHVLVNSEQLFFWETPPHNNHWKWKKKKIWLDICLDQKFSFEKMTHLQNTLKHLSAKSEGNRCISQGVLSVLNINFQYISMYHMCRKQEVRFIYESLYQVSDNMWLSMASKEKVRNYYTAHFKLKVVKFAEENSKLKASKQITDKKFVSYDRKTFRRSQQKIL